MLERLVWKYQLEPGADIRIPVGKDSRFMTSHMQFMPVMWIEHSAEGLDKEGKPQPLFDREWEVLLAGTGVMIPAGWSYLDTVQVTVAVEMMDSESGESYQAPKFIVWHIYKRDAVDY